MSRKAKRARRLKDNDDEDQRSPFRRDRDRILYSDAFRRLSGVTQVARVGESYQYHDRLSHSLKVAQVSRTLAEILLEHRNYTSIDIEDHVDPDVAEAASLAHDLGHPPFGHGAEEELNELVDRAYGGFEGNAQAFRIVANSELRREDEPGLNLTYATYNAILKYPWKNENKDEFTDGDKWGCYPTEEDIFEEVRDKLGPGKGDQSLEAQIMDYADDLTYAIHDLEDFYRAGLIPLDQLLVGTGERERVKEFITDDGDIMGDEVDAVFDRLNARMTTGEELKTPFKGSDSEIAELNSFTSNLVQKYLAPFSRSDVKIDEDSLTLVFDDRIEKEIEILKSLTVFYVIDNTSLISQQYGQREIIRKLYECLTRAADPEEDYYDNVIPHPYRNRVDDLSQHEEMKRTRIIVDLITSMTERQAVSFYERITGQSQGSIREGILR